MIEIVEERRVDAPPDVVWAQVEPVERLPGWFELAENAEALEGEGLGRRQRITGHWGNKRSEVDQVVTEYRPCEALVWRHEAERLDGKPAPKFARSTDFSIELQSDDGATLVRLRSRQEPAGPLQGMVMRLAARRALRVGLRRSLDRLAASVRI